MNKIVMFRLCTLTDKELFDKVDAMTDEMYENQKIPVRHIPARPNEDYDLLVGELLARFRNAKLNSRKTPQTFSPDAKWECCKCGWIGKTSESADKTPVVDNMYFLKCPNCGNNDEFYKVAPPSTDKQ
jgi:hypothetical protein